MWSLWTCVYVVLLVGAATRTAPNEYDVIVVGMGSAGTTAASRLARAGRRVLALDAQGHLGGRVHTIDFGDGIVELGAEWIHGTVDSRVYEAAVSHNVSTREDPERLILLRSDGRQSSNDEQEIFLAGSAALDENGSSDKFESLCDFGTRRLLEYILAFKPQYANDTQLIAETIRVLDVMTGISDSSNSWTELDASAFYDNLDGNQGISWHKHGYRTFFNILLNKHNGGSGLPSLKIKLNTEVTQIQWPTQPEQKVLVTCRDGAVYSADTAIVTVSLGVLKERHASLFSPALPRDKVAAIETVAMGAIGKIIMSFDHAWWSNRDDWYTFKWTAEDLQAVPAEDQWTTRIAGTTFSMGSTNTITFWIAGEGDKLMETLPDELITRKTMAVLRRFLANTTIPEPTAMIRSSWYSNPFVRGGYSYDSIMAASLPGARALLAAPLTDASGRARLLFAGEATHDTRFATVHGAADTGHREAERLLAQTHYGDRFRKRLKNKSDVYEENVA